MAAGIVFGQTSGSPAAFEAADVHPSAPAEFEFLRGPFFHHGGLYELRDATMADLVAAAYGVQDNQVSGGPSWLEMDRFDVLAKTGEKPSQEALRTMLQALLADRFQLAAHRDAKPMPAFALTVGKRPALKKSEGAGETGCKFVRPPPASGGLPIAPGITMDCHNMTMAAFAQAFVDDIPAFPYVGDSPVVDQTGLEGAWDFQFHFTGIRQMSAEGATTLFDALEKQLGLKLEATKIPMPAIVVDGVNRTPTPNAPDIRERLDIGPAPTEFEVADVKPGDPNFRGIDYRVTPSGQVNIRGATMKFLIQQAWDLPPYMIAETPKWMDQDRFDIVAKAPASAMVMGPDSRPEVDNDALETMLRSLLKERFKLEAHMEDRPAEAYALTAVKPKMKAADPDSRTKFEEAAATPGAKDPRIANPALSRLVTCQNMTMAQFARELRRIAPGYIHSPVLDKTGLEGGWDFTLSFSPIGVMRGGVGRGVRGGDEPAPAEAGASAAPGASDPTGAISLFDAIEKQLGLKLIQEKRPVKMLVIGHAEQKPTDN